jgi:predicted chitinase
MSPSTAFLKVQLREWELRTSRRYKKWRFYRYKSRRPEAERLELRSKWWASWKDAEGRVKDLKEQIKAKEKKYSIGWRSIQKVTPHLSNAKAQEIANALAPAFAQFNITTPRRAAMAVAQFAHESAGFRTTTEYASGAAYEGRKDLGNTQPGDGKRFRGRGYIQITGRHNYTNVSKALGYDFVKDPSDLAKPEWAAKASCWWWNNAGCNGFADRDDFKGLTRRINGGYNGLADRQTYYGRARQVAQYLVPKKR